MAAASPTQRSLKLLRDRGYLAEVVEKWQPLAKGEDSNGFKRSGYRKDLFGFIDIVAIREGEILGVQACAYSSVSARCKKIADSEHVDAVRKAGIGIVVHGWRKNAKGRYEVREVDCS